MNTENVEDIYELSPLQEGMLFHTLLTPESGMYFEQVGFPLHGPLNVPSFERAWQKVIDRHTILRTSFHWEDLEKPVQVVHRHVKLAVEYLDWSASAPAQQEEGLEALLKGDRERGFELSAAPLMRLILVDLGGDVRYVVFSLHHLLLDGWSSNVVYREAAALYETFCRGEELELPPCRPYGDYIGWLQRQDMAKAEAYWRDTLKGYEGPPPLGVGRPQDGPSHHSSGGAEVRAKEISLRRETFEALRLVARRNGLTPNTIIQGAWALLLSRYTGERDVVFGASVSGRPPELQGVESMVGLFINTLPVRARVAPDVPLLPWLKELQGQQFAARQFEHTPLAQIHSWSGVPREVPLFETLVAFQNFPTAPHAETNGGGALKPHCFGMTNYPLALMVWPDKELWVRLMYAHPRFEPQTIGRLLGHFRRLLEAIAENPERRLADIPMLTEGERRQLAGWNETSSDYPRDATIHQIFEEQARATPQATAVTFEGERLSYDQLNRRASRLARRLRRAGLVPETAVAVCVDRPTDLATGMLGILKAGGAYVPLDTAYPKERLLFMLKDSAAAGLVTTRRLAAALPAQDVTVLALDDTEAPGDDGSDEPPNRTTAESLAYVMYTSGSTGRPKGTAIPHRAVVRTVRDTNYIKLGPSDVIAQISNFCFDASTFEVWGALLNGGRLAGLPKAVTLSPDDFRLALRGEGITAVFVTTDLFNQLVRERPDVFLAVNNVLVGGSASDVKWIAACLLRAPRRLLHVYGPTESTSFASWHLVDRVAEGARTIPIGAPLANTQLYVLDRGMSQVPAGVAGELYIGGDGLARGYLNQPGLTAEKFVPDPFGDRPGGRLYRTGDRVRRGDDGAIEFLGRFDDQVKIRGFRVEPGEIEAALRAHAAVADAVVLARADAPGSKRLAAYVVPANGELSVSDLRRFLGERLPDYMVPSVLMLRDSLPLTPNGKINRRALTAAEERPATEKPYAKPRTPAEKTLADIWAQVLSVERVGIYDNFFELGGDSIISIQIIARAREAGLDLTLRQLFQNLTVADLAKAAGTEAGAPAEQSTLEGDVPLTPIQYWFFEQEMAHPHHFNQAVLIETPSGLDPTALARATEQIMIHHDALRLRYSREAGEWRQFYAPPGEAVPFLHVALRAVAEPALRARIARDGEQAQESLNLESGPIVRVAWFDLGERPGRLLMVIHHLAVDAVSWRILMEDFWHAYDRLSRGEVVALQPKTSSLRQWALRLGELAQSPEARDELPYWLAAAEGDAGRVPLDLPGGENVVAATASITVELDEAETHALVHDVPRAYRTQINDALLVALAQSLAAWTGSGAVRFDLEGHGREPLFGEVDLTRTVGWFTSIFPVRIEVGRWEAGEALKSVKEQLRRIPNRGITYGLLRYRSLDPSVIERLKQAPQPEVGFNYLGQFADTAKLESSGRTRSARARRRHLIEIDGAIWGGRLRVEWVYSENHHRRATVDRVAEDFIGRLRSLIEHCRSLVRAGFTPSDFAQAGISQKDLDKLVAAVEGAERPAA